ncbi:BnaCnng67760D [Brassica napus]|uniref:BnaCnng67760D protein n=1 Tax=Brassica napus TaxID=3708 RepID=A0A078JXY9_BRANA|nr:BnaCnng67760D [Brassica napus]
MAIIHVELIMARMVQEFEWSTDPTERRVDFAGKLVFTVVMKNSLRA